jgi:hypothetical protein
MCDNYSAIFKGLFIEPYSPHTYSIWNVGYLANAQPASPPCDLHSPLASLLAGASVSLESAVRTSKNPSYLESDGIARFSSLYCEVFFGDLLRFDKFGGEGSIKSSRKLKL